MKLSKIILSTAALALFHSFGAVSLAMAADAQLYDTPADAVEELCVAVRTHNKDCLSRIFGSEADDMIYSGDEVQDRDTIERFREKFVEKHSLRADGDKRMILIVGNEDWPFPIPLVSNGTQWHFDTEEGKDEIINRRVGANELNAIATAKAVVVAQQEYFKRAPLGKKEYAKKILSTHGKKDGLFWPREPKQKPSPLGPLVAQALAEGYERSEDGPVPFHGYYFRLMTTKRGFTLVAYPSNYGSSGVMTFVTDESGKLLERDLGEETEKLALEVKRPAADPLWTAVDENQ